jgi:hypothetical protein
MSSLALHPACAAAAAIAADAFLLNAVTLILK